MEVDDAKRAEPSKDKITAEADVDVKNGDKPKNNTGVAPLTTKRDKNKKVCKESLRSIPSNEILFSFRTLRKVAIGPVS